MPPPLLRCFVAVFPSTEVRERLARQIHDWAAEGHAIKWVEPENLHVTLKFLGQVTEADTVNLARELAGITASQATHRARVRGVGAFPNVSKARTIWAGFSEGGDELCALAADIEDGCRRLGFQREQRRFSPHITLGRRKGRGAPESLPDLPSLADADFGSFEVREVCLMSSNLRRAGPTYVRLATAPLG